MSLIEILKCATSELKTEYVEKSIVAAKAYIQSCLTREYDYSRIRTKAEYNAKVEFNRHKYIFSHVENGAKHQSEYIEKAERAASAHYSDSILKLSERVAKKGLNVNLIAFKTARVAENIECELTDGFKVVRCWTIVAWGEIQRPHYRFLVK